MSPERRRGGVLVVSCYELGHQPLAAASALGFLARAGFDADALDVAIEGLDAGRVRRARLVAIAVPMHTALRLGVRVAERVRELNPRARICFFGLYAWLNADRLLEGLSDAVIGGEPEAALVRLAEAVERSDRLPIAGVVRRGERPEPALERLSFTLPRRDRLPPLDRYAPLIDAARARTAGHVETTRGCLHLCRHCPIVPVYRGRLFAVPTELVLADARQQVEQGATHITFGDPDFLNAPGHALRILKRLHAEHPALTFDATAKVEHLLAHRDLLPELRRLGLIFVVSAFESLSDEVLARLDKGHTRADLDAVLAVLDRTGLPVRPSFVPFTPWSGLEDYLDLLAWIERHDLCPAVDPIQLAIRLLVPPGSRLLEIPPATGWPGPLDAEALTHRWQHADPRVDALQLEVARRVEEAARLDEEAERTLSALAELALEAAGAARRPLHRPMTGPRRDRPPRLAEAWFC